MKKACLAEAVFVTTENKVGMLSDVCAAMAKASVNISALCAGAAFMEAHFIILTDDCAKTISALASGGFKANKLEVVRLALKDKKGTLAAIAKKIKKARVDLDYVFGTTCGCLPAGQAGADTENLLVLVSKNNKKLVSVLNGK